MPDLVLDIFTLFGPVPPRGAEPGTGRLLALLNQHGVAGAVTLSTRGLYYNASAGNRETLALCQEAGPQLLPAAVLDPRLPNAAATVGDARMLCILPATQQWPPTFAPLTDLLQSVASSPVGKKPLWWEVSRPGDATHALAILKETSWSAPVVFGGVTSSGLMEAIAVAKKSDQIFLATNGLAGIGEVAFTAQNIGANRVVFASGAPARSLGSALALVRQAELPDADKALILGENTKRLLAGGGAA